MLCQLCLFVLVSTGLIKIYILRTYCVDPPNK